MVPGKTGVDITTERMKSIKRVLWTILFLNLIVALAKFLYGVFSHSASMQADGVHSFFDSMGNVVGIVGIMLAARPADASHPYGHSKFETYGSLIIGVMLLFAAGSVAMTAIQNLSTGTYHAVVSPMSYIIMVGTLIVNLGVTTYEHKMAKSLKSEILSADASHTLSDALVSIGVIIGLALTHMGFGMADSIMALVVSCAILFTAYDVFKSASATLSDHARIPEEDIFNAVIQLDGVSHIHKIRTRGTEGEVYVDMHVLVDPEMTVKDSHELTHDVEHLIQDKFTQVVEVLVHIEPDDGHID